ncbi:single-stranded DNA-binding protein [Deinococcus ruber]|uniref:Single-stranded DNA-binding protein n=1 Tax=Deinococcus ruber TaxID=1848197 RepID=A0A918C6V5_9DEIO|nr:single-stranded DNA-binding protein [Deinococcus ruber]GGR09671.1 hypothetical protein GCM10008957_23020 [Deinococcus ruber]
MRGSISGHVARIQVQSDRNLTVVSLTGLTGNGQDDEHPFIQNIRFEGPRQKLLEGLAVGDCAFVEVLFTYAQWKTDAGEERSQNFMFGQTLYRTAPEQVIQKDGYVCPLHCVNEIRLRVRLVKDPSFKVQRGKRLCEARVACSDQGESHFYNLTAWHDLADALAKGQKGDTLMVTVKARKEKWTDLKGEHWRDHIEVRSLCRSPKSLQQGRLAQAGD